MTDFQKFSKLVHARWDWLSKNHELYVVGKDRAAFATAYIASFPEGTNPMYLTNTEHDCSCCKNFITHLGNLVAIVDGRVETVWDVEGAPGFYAVVAKAMADFTRAQPIERLFRTKEGRYGAESNVQLMKDGTTRRWHHFHGDVNARHRSADPGEALGKHGAGLQVLGRGLDEIKPEALSLVLELIDGKSLYRGEEHLGAVRGFKRAQDAYLSLDAGGRSLFVWANATAPFALFRNTVIGTLVLDLSEGRDTEAAVGSFETKVAPQNYKRPTALITPGMVKSAMATIIELGIEPALERRFARASDMAVNNVLWVDNGTRRVMRGGLENMLLDATAPPQLQSATAERISIEDFMRDIVPQSTSMEVLLKGTHLSNFVSLTAPQHADAPPLFKWDNGFAWSYDGNIADSAIKERVKAAGGNVTNAKLRVSLGWSNYDDLDIHVHTPKGEHIHYANKLGHLDVDMNAGGGRSRTPVENVSWTSLKDGQYSVRVHQFAKRENTDVGFVVEIESAGQVIQLSHPKAVQDRDFVAVCTIDIKDGVIAKLTPASGMVGGGISQEKWGVKTETAVKVNMLMYSPNHWDGNQVGNRHWIFVLDGCRNPDPTRGIYNEFLSAELDKHRKVFEVLGAKTMCRPDGEQLSGIGFSSTKADTVAVRVTGPRMNRTFNVAFADAPVVAPVAKAKHKAVVK